MHEKNSSHNHPLIVPNSAFVTFNSEEGFRHWAKRRVIEINNENVKFFEATEPTNIIWENRFIA
jgi:hypothetical protein